MAITADQTPATSTAASNSAWRGFVSGPWRDVIDVRDFIQRNYTPYDGDDTFLAPATERTAKVWTTLTEMFPEERAKGVYDIDTHVPGTITSHAPGYISRDDEIIVGLQTDAPLKRAMIPNGGWRMVEGALKTYGYETDPDIAKIFTEYRKTHNQGVFDVYPPSAKAARHSHIITGLPDAYGRGRIIGDYRRVALYGIDALVAAKKVERAELMMERPTEETLREREENAEQIRALSELKSMAASYGYDISGPATNAREAVQWLYFAYLGCGQGAERRGDVARPHVDLHRRATSSATSPRARSTESAAQEIIDDFVIKLRIVRFLRTPEYDALFSGDPTWVTESIGGIGDDGRSLVTKSSFRYLNTLYNLGPAPEPNLTVLWSPELPEGFKAFCAKVSIDTSAIQYESDELVRDQCGDDAAIACCVSGMTRRQADAVLRRAGQPRQGAAVRDQRRPGRDDRRSRSRRCQPPVEGDVLDYDDVRAKYDHAARLAGRRPTSRP